MFQSSGAPGRFRAARSTGRSRRNLFPAFSVAPSCRPCISKACPSATGFCAVSFSRALYQRSGPPGRFRAARSTGRSRRNSLPAFSAAPSCRPCISKACPSETVFCAVSFSRALYQRSGAPGRFRAARPTGRSRRNSFSAFSAAPSCRPCISKACPSETGFCATPPS